MLGRHRLTLVPAVFVAAYLVVQATSLSSVFTQLAWDADANSPMLIAETLARDSHGGGVLVGHMGYYPMLAFDVLTYSVPFHRELWTVFPYFLSLTGLGLLAWVAWRAGGRWAAFVTFSLGITASPTVLLSLASQGYRAATMFNTILLMALLIVLLRRTWPSPLLLASGAVVSIITGIDLASDTFLALWGLGPFVLAAIAVAATRPNRWHFIVATQAAGIALLSGLCSLATSQLAHRLGFRLLAVDTRLATSVEIMSHVRLLFADLVILFSGPLAGPPIGPRVFDLLLRPVMAVLGLAGLGAVGVLLVNGLRRGDTNGLDTDLALACLVFWSASIALVAGPFILTTFATDTTSTRYLLTLFFAVATVLPLWAAGSARRRQGMAVVIAFACVYSGGSLISSVRHQRFQPVHTLELPAAVRVLDAVGLRRGYSTYWDANAITWETAGRITIYPVYETPDGTRPFISNVVTSWYQGVQPGRSFVLVDPRVPFVTILPDSRIGSTTALLHEGRFTIAVYDRDIGDRLH